MATISTMAMLHAKHLSMSSPSNHLKPSSKSGARPTSLIPLENLPKGLSISNPASTSAAIAGVIFSALTSSDAAFAAQQIADIAEGDNRGLALLIPIVPAIAWVLYNILQPALNQINRMTSDKGFMVGVGLGAGLAAGAALMSAPQASAGEIMMVADASSSSPSDSRGLLLLFVVAPAILWVLYNILQPALNQLNRMRSG